MTAAPHPRRAVTWRSVMIGFLGVLFICSLTPYNDYVVNNTNLVGSFLPVGLLLFFLVLVLFVNAPLRWLAPRRAISGPELSVALGMMLVSCTLPSVGLMRYLPGHLVAFWHHAAADADAATVMRRLDLPDWMFPTMPARDPVLRGNEPVVRDFFNRVPVEMPGFAARVRAVPWAAWARPAVTWAALLACLYGTAFCMMVIFRRQWAENERLPFPLATVYLSLIEPPEPGRALNRLFRARSFWVAFAAVFAVHGVNGLSEYAPKIFPAIPLGFDLRRILANEPWRYVELYAQVQTLYFIVIGICIFLQTKLAFSLWSIFLLVQVARMVLGARQQEITGGMQTDQQFGAILAVGAVSLWVARQHLRAVLRQMVGRARAGDPRGRYLPYSAAGWGVALGSAGIVAWLMLAGTTLAGAAVIVGGLMVAYLVLARVVAETGLPYVLLPLPLMRPWVYLANDLPFGATGRTGVRSYFFANWFYGMFLHDTREAMPVYASHALRVADVAAYSDEGNWRKTLPFVALLAAALLVGYAVAGSSYLYAEYSYATTLDRRPVVVNVWGARDMAKELALNATRDYLPPNAGPTESHSRPGHLAFGAGLTLAMGALRLRYAAWPFHPIGFLLVYTWGVQQVWFSLFVGWLAKVLILRLGGARLLRGSYPAFTGLILGEAAAAAFWLVVSLLLVAAGMNYHAVQLLPR